MKRILTYLKPYVGRLLLAALLLALSTLCDLLLPTLMSDILEKGVRGQDFAYILRCCTQMLVVAATSLVALLLGIRLSTRVVSAFCADLRADIFRKVNTFSFEEFGAMGTAALVTRATHDVETVSWIALMLCSSVASVPLLFIGGTVLALRKDVTLSLVLLFFIPFIFAAVILIGRRVLPLWDKSDLYIDKQNAIMRERLRGIRVIRAFHAEPREQARIAEATHVMADNIIRANVSMGLLTPLSSLLLNLAVVLIVWFGAQRLSAGIGSAGAGDILAIIQYISLVMNSLMTASFAVIMYPHAQVAAGRIGQIFEAKGMGDSSTGRSITLSGDIRFEHVSFSYGGEENAVEDISLHIRPGQRIAIIGGTGSGKSTLIALLLGFRTPTQGQICFDGVPATALSKHSLRAGISAVLQGAAIYSGTIEENIRMGKPDATDAELEEAARIAQLSDFIAGCEGGMQHEIRQAGKNLSGGQKQRLSIARAIVRDVPIYIFDDSFSALDFLTEKHLRSALNEKTAGRTQLVVTQRVTSAMHADCIYVLERGRLADFGTHAALLSRCKIYQEIFASQTGGGSK